MQDEGTNAVCETLIGAVCYIDIVHDNRSYSTDGIIILIYY